MARKSKKSRPRRKDGSASGRHRIPLALAACAALLALSLGGAYVLLRPLRASLIGLDAAERTAVERAFSEAKIPVVLADRRAGELDAVLSAAVPDDLVFARSGLELHRARLKLAAIPPEIHRRVPQPLLWAATPSDGIRALPLLADHFEVAWRWDEGALPSPLSREGFDRGAAAQVGQAASPLMFAGGDDETLLQALSALCLALSGAEAYREAIRSIANGTGNAEALFEPGGPLGPAVAELRRWKAAGYLRPEWGKLTPPDVKASMERGMANLVLQSLSFHRTVPYRTIFDFRSGPFPSYGTAGRSAIVSPLTVVAAPARGFRSAAALRAIGRLSEPAQGYVLAQASGRASALAAARAPDVQAADALAWAAGRRTVVSGLFRDAFTDPVRAAAFAAAVREAVNR